MPKCRVFCKLHTVRYYCWVKILYICMSNFNKLKYRKWYYGFGHVFSLIIRTDLLCNCERLKRVSFFRTLQSVKNLQKKENKSDSAKVIAFQQLLLLMAIHLFKVRPLKHICGIHWADSWAF